MKIAKVNWVLGLITVLALVLRLVALDKFPYGFHFDEAKAAWNAVSIATTGMDDHSNKLPLYYDSFGDFRPTGIIYLLIPFVTALGRNLWAVRLPAAILGGLSVVGIYWLMQELIKDNKERMGLWAAFFLAINPWHVNVSRATSEVIVAMFLTIWGLFFLIKAIRTNSYKWAIAAVGAMGLSYLFYHSIRILGPIFGIITLGYFGIFEKYKLKMRWAIVAVMVLTVMSLVLMAGPEAKSRLGQVSITSDFKILYETQKGPNEAGANNVLVARAFHNRLTVTGRRLAEEYFSYFGSDFLVGRTAKPLRYVTMNMGLITYIEFGLIFLGVAATVKRKGLRWAWMGLLLAPLPAAVTLEDVPNLHRSMMMVPFLVLIMAGGMVFLIENSRKWVVAINLCLLAANYVYYLHFYYNHGNFAMSVYSRNGGMVEMLERIDEEKQNYNKIVLTNYSDNPYAWYAFLSGKKPDDFNSNYKKNETGMYQYENLIFSSERCPTNLLNDAGGRKNYVNSLFVNGEGCEINQNLSKETKIKLKETIYRLDGSPPFTLWELR